MSDIQLGGDAAVVGGVHSDSHNVETHNTTTTHNSTVTDNSKTINNNVVHQAQLTDTQIRQETKINFCKRLWLACKMAYSISVNLPNSPS